MNPKVLKFIEWLSQNVEEFKGKSEDETAAILNQLSLTDEGKQQLSQLMGQFNSSVSQFRAGGKFASFVKKFDGGGKSVFNFGRLRNPISGRVAEHRMAINNNDPEDRQYRYADGTDTVGVDNKRGIAYSNNGKRRYIFNTNDLTNIADSVNAAVEPNDQKMIDAPSIGMDYTNFVKGIGSSVIGDYDRFLNTIYKAEMAKILKPIDDPLKNIDAPSYVGGPKFVRYNDGGVIFAQDGTKYDR